MTTTEQKTNLENRVNPAFCDFHTWHACLPLELQRLNEEAWRRKSSRMEWPPYMRILGQKSQAFWKRQDISDAFATHFLATHEHCVRKLVEAGFPEPEALIEADKGKSRKAGRKRQKEYGRGTPAQKKKAKALWDQLA